MTHSMRLGTVGNDDASPAYDREAADRGLGILATHARQLRAELDALGAHVATESGAAGVDHGASWPYLVD
jgi:hypothetical protein